jgi:tol-pal system protein YbgF
MKAYLLLLLAALLVLPSCAQNLQNQVDEQGKEISRLQLKNKALDRSMQQLRDDYKTNFERIPFEKKSMRAATEQKVQQPQADAAGQQGETVETAPPGGDGAPAPVPPRPAPPSAAATDKDMYNQAYGIYSSRDYERARKAFGDFIKTHPGSQLVSSAQYWIASSYFKEKKYEEAISACDDVIKKYPQGSKTPDAYYLQALSFVEIKDPTTAQIILEDLIQKYPASEAATVGKQKYEELKSNN